jgi:hypothetical protein
LGVTNSACAISRFVIPEAAIEATRRSDGISERTPDSARPARPGPRRAQLDERLGVLETGGGDREHLQRLAHERAPACAIQSSLV